MGDFEHERVGRLDLFGEKSMAGSGEPNSVDAALNPPPDMRRP